GEGRRELLGALDVPFAEVEDPGRGVGRLGVRGGLRRRQFQLVERSGMIRPQADETRDSLRAEARRRRQTVALRALLEELGGLAETEGGYESRVERGDRDSRGRGARGRRR